MNGSAKSSFTSASVQSLRTVTNTSFGIVPRRRRTQYSVPRKLSQPRMPDMVDVLPSKGSLQGGLFRREAYLDAADESRTGSSLMIGTICSGESDQAAIASSQYAAS